MLLACFHNLLLAKLEAYGLDNNAVKFMRSYQANRVQHCEIINSLNEWAKTSDEDPKGSILDLLLLNIYFDDILLFIQKCDLANYADDSTIYASDKCVSTIVHSLSHEFTLLSKWFYNKFMALNPDKFSFILFRVCDSLQTALPCCVEILKNIKQVLGETLDNRLNFTKHLFNITKNITDQKKFKFSFFI